MRNVLFICAVAAIALASSCSKETTTAPEPTTAIIRIFSFVPNPEGNDDYSESFTLKNSGTADGSINGWKILDNENVEWKLSGVLQAEDTTKIISDKTAQLLNGGDTVRLVNDKGETIQTISYTDAKDGEIITP